METILRYEDPTFQNQGIFPHYVSETKSVTPNFFCISDIINLLADHS